MNSRATVEEQIRATSETGNDTVGRYNQLVWKCRSLLLLCGGGGGSREEFVKRGRSWWSRKKREQNTSSSHFSSLLCERHAIPLILIVYTAGGRWIHQDNNIPSHYSIFVVVFCFCFSPTSQFSNVKRLSVKKDKITRKHGREMHGRRKTRVGKKFHFWIYRKTGSVCVCFSRG